MDRYTKKYDRVWSCPADGSGTKLDEAIYYLAQTNFSSVHTLQAYPQPAASAGEAKLERF